MTMIKVPLQCRCSAIKSAIENGHSRRSNRISAISAVENREPAPCARNGSHMQKQALTALIEPTPTLTSENTIPANGTATALPPGGTR